MAAGIPCSLSLPPALKPGVVRVTLIGSKQHVVFGDIAEAVPVGARLQHPIMGADLIGALHLLRLPDAEPPVVPVQVLPYVGQARRKLRASSKVSWISERPAGPSIIAEATSSEAMMPYCGEVEMCIMKASLKRATSSFRVPPSRTWIIEAWLKAASILCVEWVANTRVPPLREVPMP